MHMFFFLPDNVLLKQVLTKSRYSELYQDA